MRHLGASPIGVANTRRLHFAKKLIDETHLPMGQIAIASGFGSVRRFNAAFRKTYNRTPSEIRRFAHLASKQLEHEYLFRLHFRPPFQWDALLDFLGRRAIPGVESVEDGSYRRTISLNGDSGSLAVSIDESDSALQVRISFPDPRWLFLIIERVRRMFDLAADPNEIDSDFWHSDYCDSSAEPSFSNSRGSRGSRHCSNRSAEETCWNNSRFCEGRD